MKDTEYAENVKLIIISESTMLENIKKEITNTTSGKAVFDIEDEKDYFKEGNILYLGIKE